MRVCKYECLHQKAPPHSPRDAVTPELPSTPRGEGCVWGLMGHGSMAAHGGKEREVTEEGEGRQGSNTKEL